MTTLSLNDIDKQIEHLRQKDRQLEELEETYNRTVSELSQEIDDYAYAREELSSHLMALADRYPSSYYDFLSIEEDIRQRTYHLTDLYDEDIAAVQKKRRQAMDDRDELYYQKLTLNRKREDALEEKRRQMK